MKFHLFLIISWIQRTVQTPTNCGKRTVVRKKKNLLGQLEQREIMKPYPTFLHVEINLLVTLPGFCMANKGSFHPTTAQHTGVFSMPTQTWVVNRAQGTLALTLMKWIGIGVKRVWRTGPEDLGWKHSRLLFIFSINNVLLNRQEERCD